MSFFTLLFAIFIFVANLVNTIATEQRAAIVITLAGTHKVVEYFEWSCKSISGSADYFDLVVFHEDNEKLKTLKCAANVKFINLGQSGISKLIVNKILESTTSTTNVTSANVMKLLDNILLHIPRYLVEIKPMTGDLFSEWLAPYSHWSYSDPDIIWGDLTSSVDKSDFSKYHIWTISKLRDAGRLFVRGQFALHQNTPQMNKLWRELPYLQPAQFATRIARASKMLASKTMIETIFSSNFVSAEGAYSQLLFSQDWIRIKIASIGFDDFSRAAVVRQGNGVLHRCDSHTKTGSRLPDYLAQCIRSSAAVPVVGLVPFKMHAVTTVRHDFACQMQWLKPEYRFCVVEDAYSSREKAGKDAKLVRANTACLEKGQWTADVTVSAGNASQAQLFHFRHWDDFASSGAEVDYGPAAVETGGGDLKSCMVLYLQRKGPGKTVMIFQDCDVAIASEAKTARSAAVGDRTPLEKGGKRRGSAVEGTGRKKSGRTGRKAGSKAVAGGKRRNVV